VNDDNTIRKLFLGIILFDKNYNFLDVAYAQLKGTAGNYTLLSANYTVKKEDYAYVYISNENATAVDVYFDDITMTYTPTNVVQYNEYYPFGMQTADSWTRDNASNNFLYNEGSELNQTSGFYDLPFRNYDASLGRFFQVDPLSYRDNATSPFAYAGNNPVVFNDPQGLMVSAAGLSDYQLRMMYRRDMAGYLSYDDWASQNVIEYAAGKGFDNMNGSGGSTWGSWSSTPIFGLLQGRKPRYETEGYDYMELGIVGYEWSYTPGNGGSPFDQVMGDPAVSSAGSPIGEWGGSQAQQGGPSDHDKLMEFANYFFSDEIKSVADNGFKLTFELDVNEKYTTDVEGRRHALTIPIMNNKEAKMYLHPFLLNDPKNLYIHLAHELVHANDIANGNFTAWLKQYPGYIVNIMEARGFMVSAAVEAQFEKNYTDSQKNLDHYKSLLPAGFILSPK